MAETTIIPVELKKLIRWHVAPHGHTVQVEKFMAATFTPREVEPLDLADLKKTQRRVATLLGQPGLAANERKSRQHLAPVLGYTTCRRCNAQDCHAHSQDPGRDGDTRVFYKRLVVNTHGPVQLCRYAGDTLALRHSDGGLFGQSDSQNTGKEGGEEAAFFSLPSVFKDERKYGYLTTKDGGRIPPDKLECGPDNVNMSSPPPGDRLSLPAVGPGRHLVTGQDGRNGLDSNLDPTHKQRELTLESERSGGSLKIDEDYVPMSVSVRKVTNMDLKKSGSSPYQAYSEFFSSSPSGRRTVSRESTATRSEYTDSTVASAASILQRGTSWCRCPEGVSTLLPSGGGLCSECGLTGDDHERWCLSLGALCLHCRRPIRKSWSGYGSRSNLSRGVGSRELSADLLVTTKLSGLKSPEKSFDIILSGGTEGQDKQPRSREKGRERSGNSGLQRVRFADPLQQISSADGALSPKPTPSDNGGGKGHEPAADELGGKRTAWDDQSSRLHQTSTRFRSRINQNIHRDAYILALKDAHSQPVDRKQKKKKNKQRKKTESRRVPAPQAGIIFSYFPSLRRPRSETDMGTVFELGLRQDNGAKVKLKDAMKHIFGKVKLADYYPGGKKYPLHWES